MEQAEEAPAARQLPLSQGHLQAGVFAGHSVRALGSGRCAQGTEAQTPAQGALEGQAGGVSHWLLLRLLK